MKLFGAINDGYRFIYSTEKQYVEDWLSIYPKNFCILKVFEIDIENNHNLARNNDLFINFKFDKSQIPQNEYTDIQEEKMSVVFSDELALITPVKYNFLEEKFYKIDLIKEDYIILNASRNFLMRKKEV